jgi:hypothetical protein
MMVVMVLALLSVDEWLIVTIDVIHIGIPIIHSLHSDFFHDDLTKIMGEYDMYPLLYRRLRR